MTDSNEFEPQAPTSPGDAATQATPADTAAEAPAMQSTPPAQPMPAPNPMPQATVYTPGAAPTQYGAPQISPAAPQAPPSAPQPAKRSGMPVAATIAIAALVGGGVGAGVVGSAWVVNSATSAFSAGAPSQNVTINDTDSVTAVSAVAAKALPSVVTISVSSGQNGGTGSGVVISADGYIVTNTHVATLDGATNNPTISVSLSDGRILPGTLVGTDPYSDLAVVKVEATNLTPIEFADSDSLNVGSTTVAIGAPMELSDTVTQGIVSALYRGIEIQSSAAPDDSSGSQDGGSSGSSPFEFWNNDGQSGSGSTQASATIALSVIQTDAAINPGNSGGALLDTNAKLIGINVAILSDASASAGTAGSIGIGFAIPSNQVKRVAQELIETGKATHGLLGASVTSTAADAGVKGAIVKEVTSGGAAAKAGVQAGDIITQFNGVRVNDQVDLTARVRSLPSGSKATLTVIRNDQTQQVDVVLGTFAG